MCQFKKKDTSF
jgi:26S proteasome regulatory subunit N5